jgi:uncharacterized membrane protein YkoI
MRQRVSAALFGFVIALVPLASAQADPRGHDDERYHDDERHHDRRDHDAARGAVERGEIKPLAELLKIVDGKLPGEITGVEVERKRDQWLYEFHVVDKNGRLLDVYVDAQSGEIQRTREK